MRCEYQDELGGRSFCGKQAVAEAVDGLGGTLLCQEHLDQVLESGEYVEEEIEELETSA